VATLPEVPNDHSAGDPYPFPPLPATWDGLLPATATPAFHNLRSFLAAEARAHSIHPPPSQLFRALELTPFDRVRVVLLGQDPYHGPNQAEGLCFSVPPGVPSPPSLRNIVKELRSDLGHAVPTHGSLAAWARQGVLLLNTVLTVREGAAHAHAGRGWEEFTDAILRLLSERPKSTVFALWGAHAQRKIPLINAQRHAIVTAAHPSPLSAYRGFLGSRPFSRLNAALTASGQSPIDWHLD